MMALENPLTALKVYGQSVWLDYIRRNLITSGELQRLITEDGLRGVTSNPAIFEKAIAGSTDYQAVLEAPEARGLDAKSLYEKLAVSDIQDAADILRPVYERTPKRDGYVSLEVSPFLAHDTEGTLEEARRLWKAVGRENVMIKVPANTEGIPAIQKLISEGINVNVTLLFSQEAYERVAEAYIAGLEQLAARGGDLKQVASVASFFVSRIDTAIDALIAARLKRRRMRTSRRCCAASPARWRSPTPSSPISAIASSSAARAGRRWPTGARRRSGCCGRARARRIRTTATSSMSKS